MSVKIQPSPYYYGFTEEQRRTFGALMRAAAAMRRKSGELYRMSENIQVPFTRAVLKNAAVDMTKSAVSMCLTAEWYARQCGWVKRANR